MEKIREFKIGNDTYSLVSKRSIALSLRGIIPELFDLKDNKNRKQAEVDLGIKLYDNLDFVFYEMIKVKHPDLSRDESNVIFEKFCNKYNNAEESLIELMMSAFQQGIPNTEKENLNWF